MIPPSPVDWIFLSSGFFFPHQYWKVLHNLITVILQPYLLHSLPCSWSFCCSSKVYTLFSLQTFIYSILSSWNVLFSLFSSLYFNKLLLIGQVSDSRSLPQRNSGVRINILTGLCTSCFKCTAHWWSFLSSCWIAHSMRPNHILSVSSSLESVI